MRLLGGRPTQPGASQSGLPAREVLLVSLAGRGATQLMAQDAAAVAALVPSVCLSSAAGKQMKGDVLGEAVRTRGYCDPLGGTLVK